VDALVRSTKRIEADGETVWSWPPDAEVKFASDQLADDGGYQSPDTGESSA
jgi:hypothetical protein